jgi:hypothetical protein
MLHNENILKSSVFAFNNAAKSARQHNVLYGRIFLSTPGDLDTASGSAATKLIEGMLPWKEDYFNMKVSELKKLVTSKGHNGIVFVEHHWRDLRKTMDWYEEQCRSVSYDMETIMREIDLMRLHGSSLSPFDRDDIQYISNNMKQPLKVVNFGDRLYYINLYEMLNKKFNYILSIDPSEGVGKDNNAFTLINPYTLKPVAEFKSPYISQPDLCKLIVKFLDTYCPKTSLIIVEANKGRELINNFLNTRYRHKVYFDVDKLTAKLTEVVDEYGALRQQANQRRAYGFDTTSRSRPLLFNLLETLVVEEKEKLFSQYIVSDILKLVRKKNGRIEACEGEHDDNVISYLIGLYVYLHATNLAEFGIIRGAKPPSDAPEIQTKEQIIEKIQELSTYLPKDYQDMFVQAVGKEQVEGSNYRRALEEEAARTILHSSVTKSVDMDEVEPETEELIDNAIDNEIFNSNFNSGQDVDISKYI